MVEYRLLCSLSLGLMLIAPGCYATLSSDGWGHLYVESTPPPPYVEVVAGPPAPGYVWVPGYWWWDGADYIWIRGQWELPPQPGYVYVRSGWTRVNGHYRFVHGRWVAPHRRPRVVYANPAPRVRVQTGVRYRTVRPSRPVRTRPSGSRPSQGRRRR